MTQVSSQQQAPASWPVWVILAALVGTLTVVAMRQEPDLPKTAVITGRLTLEGQPLARHTVDFLQPTRGDAASAVTDADGRFFADTWRGGDMTPGQFRVYIRPPRLAGDTSDPPLHMPNDYPDRYLDVTTTPLEYTIRLGENKIDIDLERKPSTPP